MSDSSFTAMGEKCGIASPPDTSVSSTSCVDSHLALHPAGLTALTEDMAMLDLCMPSLSKQPCDTEEGEVTSSSEIVSAFWNNFPSTLDSVYNETEKNPFSVITDEDIHCIQTALSTEEGMQILRQTMMKDLSADYGLDEQDLLTESLSESTGSTGLQTLSMPVAYTNSISNFEFATHSELPEYELNATGELPNAIPQMYPALPSDEFYSDVLEVLSSNQLDRRPLFDDDDDDEEMKPIAIDTAHIDDLVLPDLPPVEDDGRRCEAIDLEADDELVLDDNLLQSFSFIDQSYTSNADNCNSQLDFVFIDDVKLDDGFEKDSSSVDATAQGLRDAATSKHLRRSTRIQENEQREMAERIRQENIQREQEEALRADERHLEEHERNKRKDSSSLSSAINSGDSQLDLFTEHDEEILFDGSEQSSSLQMNSERAGKNIPQKRSLCQKGKGKGRGKGGKIGKYNRPTSKAVGAWSSTQPEVSDDTTSEDPLLKVEMVEEDGKDEGSTEPPSDEKSDQQDECIAMKVSVKESDSPKEQALDGVLSDEKLKAMTKVTLGRLELESVLSKPISQNAFGASQEQDTEQAEERVFSKPQTARRRKRKRTEFSYALEPAPDLTTDVSHEDNLKLDGSNSNCSFDGQSVTVAEEPAALSILPLELAALSILPLEPAALSLLPLEPADVTQGEKRKESDEEGEMLVVNTKKRKNEYEDRKMVEQLKDEVDLTGSLSEGPNTGSSSEETVASHQNCNKKDLKKTVVQKTFSQEGMTHNKIKVMKKQRSKSSLKDPNSFKSNLHKPKDKDSKPSQMESCAQEDGLQERLSEEENKSQLQAKVLGKRKADFKDKGIQDQKIALYEKYKEITGAQKEKISREGKGDKKAVRKSSRCRGCQSVVQPLSLYCNKSCLLKYANLVVQQLKEKKRKLQSLLSSGRNRSADRLVLMERSSGKRVKISLDFCETKLLNWLLRHPTYEVLKPNSQDNNRTKAASDLKLKLKRPVATCAQDLANKSSKTQDKVSPSGQDRLLPSGHPTKVASSHEAQKKVDHQRTTKPMSLVRTKSSSSSKSEEKSDKLNASHKIPTLKDGHIMDSSVKRLQNHELDAALSQNTLHQKNSSSSSTLKSKPIVKASSCTGSADKIIGRSESKSGSNKSNNNNATISRTNSRDNQGNNNCSGNRGSNSDNKSNSSSSKGSSGSKNSSVSASRNNGIDNKHGSSSDFKKNSIDNKSSKSSDEKSSSGSRKGSSSDRKSSHGNTTARQSKVVLEQEQQPAEILDMTRIDIRTELCNILTSRVNRATDVLMSIPEIKRLTLNIEDELWKSCSGIVSHYKRKYRLVLTYLTDPKNHGLFRQVLCGRVTPSHLLHMSQTDKLSNRQSSHKGSRTNDMSHSSAKASTQLMAMSDTTSMHEQHVFDVNCRVCTSKSSDLRARKNSSRPPQDSASDVCDTSAIDEIKPVTEVPQDISVKEEAQEIDADSVELPVKVCHRDESLLNAEGVPPWLNTSPVIIPKNSPRPGSDLTDPRDRTRVIPRTNSLVRIKRYPSFPSDTKASTGFTHKSEISNDIEGRPEDLHSSSISSSSGSRVWKGNIFAQDVALVAVDAYHLSGSMKFVKSLLPESLTVMGRLEPEVVYEYLTKLKTCYSATKEIAVVCFRASNDPNSSLYSLLYAYLHQRHRCGVIGSIGTAIKDMYIVPLPAKSPIPDILLPDIGPVLERSRDLLLGVIVQQTSRAARMSRAVVPKDQHSHSASTVPTEVKVESVPGADFDEKSTGLNDVSSETGNNHASESSDSDSQDVDRSDDIISGYSKTVLSKPVEEKTDLADAVDVKCEKGAAVDDGDEPYDPFDEEEEEEEETEPAVNSVVKIKPTATSSSSSSVLPTSSTSLSSKNSSMLNESIANLTAVLSTMTNLQAPVTLLATLAAQAVPPNLEGLAKLAIILSDQMNALNQEHIPNSESGITSGKQTEASVKREHATEIDDADNEKAKPRDEFGVNKSCDDMSKQSDTADNSTANGEKRDCTVADCNAGGKFESVGTKNQTDKSTASVSCHDVGKTDGFSSLDGSSCRLDDAKSFEGQTQESEGTVDDGCKANKTSSSKLQVVNTEFSHLEEDDNEDHLVIDLDSPISEDAFDTKPMGKSDSWHSGLTTVELRNGHSGSAENVNSEMADVDGIELFSDGEQAEQNSGSKSQVCALVSRAVDDSRPTENVDNLQSEEATDNLRSEEPTESPLFSPSDQDDCQEEQRGIFDSVEDEDLFSCKSFATMQDAYAYENAVMVNGDSRDVEYQEQMSSPVVRTSDALAKSKALQETFADSPSAVGDLLKVNCVKESQVVGLNSDAPLDAGGFSSPHSTQLGLAKEIDPETASQQMQSTEIMEERIDEPFQTDSDLLLEVTESPASEIPARNDEKILEEEKLAVEVNEVAPLPAPPRPPDRLLQALKPCPLPEPLLRPPSPKTLLSSPFGFHSAFNSANKLVSCVRSPEEVFQDHSLMVHSPAMTSWDLYGSGGPQSFPQTEQDRGPFDSVQRQSVRPGGPNDRALLQSSMQKFLENKCLNGVGRYDASSPSFVDSSSRLESQRPSYHDLVCAGRWLDDRTPIRTPPPLSRSWKSTGATETSHPALHGSDYSEEMEDSSISVSAGRWLDGRTPVRTPPPLSRSWESTGATDTSHPALQGSDYSEETEDSAQLGVKALELTKSSFGKKMTEPTRTGQNYLSTDEEQSGAAYRMQRHRPSSRGHTRRSSAKECRSPPLESCNRERRITTGRTDLESSGERRKSDSRYESERIDQKTRLDGRYIVDKEASAGTEYTRSWSNERRPFLSDSPLFSAGFSEDLSASSCSRGSLLHFRDETSKPLHLPAARPRQSKDDFDKGGHRSSPRGKCAGQSSDECLRQLGRSGSRLQNAEMSWSEIVSRKEATSSRDTVRLRRPSRTSIAEESLKFHDLDDRFRRDVDYPVSDRQQEGSTWMQLPGREDWRRNNASAGENWDWLFHREKEENTRCQRACSYSQEPEVKRWERAEEEQEEGEYVDDQEGDSSEAYAFRLTEAANYDKPNYELSQRSCSVSGVSLKPNQNYDTRENNSPLCVIINGNFGSRLKELRVEIDPLDAGKMPDDDEELEDGEITDPSPPLTHSIPPLLSFCSSDLWAKEFLTSRRSEKATAEPSGISSRRLERTVQPYVPHSNVTKKQKLLEEPPKRFRKPSVVDHDDRSGVYPSLLRPNYDRYIPHHQRRSGSRMPDKPDSCQRLSNFSSSGSFWNGSLSSRGPRDRSSNFYPPA